MTATASTAESGTARRDGGLPIYKGNFWWFALALAATVAGFWPTTIGPFGPPDLLRSLHGSFAATWMTMLVVQAWLVEHGFRRAHRLIGWTSIVVAPGVVITALLVVRNSLAYGPAAPFSRFMLLLLTWIDLWSLLLFLGLYAAAIAQRRQPFLHARFLGSTAFVAVIPALGRLYGMNIEALGGLSGALHPSFWTCEGLLLLFALRDGLTGRWTSPWWITLGALAFLDLTMFAAPSFAWFVHFCEVLGLPAR